MAVSTFSGPIQIGLIDSAVGIVQAARTQLIDSTTGLAAALTSDFTLVMPSTYTLLRITAVTSTAFTGNTVTLGIGTTLGGFEVVAATTIKAAGTFAFTIVAGLARSLTTSLFMRVTQTATTTAVGQANVYVEYIPTNANWS